MKYIEYQDNAINELFEESISLLNKDKRGTILLKAPTGSGKTYIMCKSIEKLIDKYEGIAELCFIWVSKSILIDQSINSIKKYIGDKSLCSKITQEYCNGKNFFNTNEIACIGWESINETDESNLIHTNLITREQEKNNLFDLLENTRNQHKKIVLIIDESHTMASTEIATKIRDEKIKADLTIEMSATPCITDYNHCVDIKFSDVIAEGMIKKDVVINSNVKEIIDDDLNSQELILEHAYQKREELKKAYSAENEKVNPLVIIQIKNGPIGESHKDSVLSFLEKKDKTISNGKVKIWLADSTLENFEKEELVKNDNEVEYLIFKEAVKEGWDCPRAQILVRLREVKSITFDIQTVGRILRMPNAKFYNNEILNRAYIYTNIQSIVIKEQEFLKNIVKRNHSIRKNIYESLSLKSYYKKRVDYGDITELYKKNNCFELVFCNKFNIQRIEQGVKYLTDFYKNNLECLKNSNINIDMTVSSEILFDKIINSQDIVDKGIIIDGDSEQRKEIKLDFDTIDSIYNQIINTSLNGFAPKRSFNKVNESIIYTLKKYLGLDLFGLGIDKIKIFVVNNQAIFKSLISESVELFRPLHEQEIQNKEKEDYNNSWEIPYEYFYNDNVKEIDSNTSIYSPLYLPLVSGKVNQLEISFINYLEKNSNKIDWFWKNGNNGKENFGIKINDKKTFYPDFIIKFKNKKIGIFDTKAGYGHNENDNSEKSNTLVQYIVDENSQGKNLIGGLVIQDNTNTEKFFYFDRNTYSSFIENPKEWKDFDELFS